MSQGSLILLREGAIKESTTKPQSDLSRDPLVSLALVV